MLPWSSSHCVAARAPAHGPPDPSLCSLLHVCSPPTYTSGSPTRGLSSPTAGSSAHWTRPGVRGGTHVLLPRSADCHSGTQTPRLHGPAHSRTPVTCLAGFTVVHEAVASPRVLQRGREAGPKSASHQRASSDSPSLRHPHHSSATPKSRPPSASPYDEEGAWGRDTNTPTWDRSTKGQGSL